MIGRSAVFETVRAFFLVILVLAAIEEVPLPFQVAVGARKSRSPSKRVLSFDSSVSEAGSGAVEGGATSSTVWRLVVVVFVWEAAEEAPFASYITFGFGARVDLRRDMIEDRLIGAILSKKEKTGAKPAGVCQGAKALKSPP